MATSIVLEQTSVLFIFAIIGWVLAKTGVINNKHSQLLSVLMIYVFMPAKFFKSFANNFTPEYISAKYNLLIISLVILVVLVIIAKQAAKFFSRDQYERNVFQYSLAITNFGYMGYVLTEALYGEAFLIDIMLFGLLIQVYINTEGYRLLTGTGKFSLKNIFNPMFIATIIGCIWGLFKLPIPSIADSALTSASGCAGAVSMLLMGLVISEQKLKPLLSDARIYIMTIIRLFIIPAIIGGILYLLLGREMTTISLMVFAMPCGLNTIVFPKLVGKDCTIGAGLALVSTIGSLISIPFWLSIWG